MKRRTLIVLLMIVIGMLLTACGGNDSNPKATTNDPSEKEADSKKEAAKPKKVEEQTRDITLPADFPADFPFPENITITEVRDNSEGEQKNFTIRFTFDPDIDLEAVFEMYDAYTEKTGYQSVVGGEEYFADGIFQYAAMLESSTSDMYVITMQPEGSTYGSADVKFIK